MEKPTINGSGGARRNALMDDERSSISKLTNNGSSTQEIDDLVFSCDNEVDSYKVGSSLKRVQSVMDHFLSDFYSDANLLSNTNILNKSQ